MSQRFIIVDEHDRPMAWDMDQLYYCTNERWKDEMFPVLTYPEKTAREVIKKHNQFRVKNGWLPDDVKLMPITMPVNITITTPPPKC